MGRTTRITGCCSAGRTAGPRTPTRSRADAAFTMKQYVQADLEADRQVAHALAELIVGGSLASVLVNPEDSGSAAEQA